MPISPSRSSIEGGGPVEFRDTPIFKNPTPTSPLHEGSTSSEFISELCDYFSGVLLAGSKLSSNQQKAFLEKLIGLPKHYKQAIERRCQTDASQTFNSLVGRVLSGRNLVVAQAYFRNKSSTLEAHDTLYLYTYDTACDNEAITRLLSSLSTAQIAKLDTQLRAQYHVTLRDRINSKMWRSAKRSALFMADCPRNSEGKISAGALKALEFREIRGKYIKHREKAFCLLETMSSEDINEACRIYARMFNMDLRVELRKEMGAVMNNAALQARLDAALCGIRGDSAQKAKYVASTFHLIIKRNLKSDTLAVKLLTDFIDNKNSDPSAWEVMEAYEADYGTKVAKVAVVADKEEARWAMPGRLAEAKNYRNFTLYKALGSNLTRHVAVL